MGNILSVKTSCQSGHPVSEDILSPGTSCQWGHPVSGDILSDGSSPIGFHQAEAVTKVTMIATTGEGGPVIHTQGGPCAVVGVGPLDSR